MTKLLPDRLIRALSLLIVLSGGLFLTPPDASAFTMTFKGDPSAFTLKLGTSTELSNGTAQEVTLSPEGTEQTFSYTGYIYYRLYPKDTSNPPKYNLYIYKAGADTPTAKFENKAFAATGYYGGYMAATTYEGGTFVVEAAVAEQPINFTIKLDGDPSKVKCLMGPAGSSEQKTLVSGDNHFSIMASTTYVFLQTAGGDAKFYSVNLNGTEKNPTWNGEGDSGYWGYTYSPNTLKEGDVINVKVEGDASTTYTFTIENAEGGVQDFSYITSLEVYNLGELMKTVDLSTFNGKIEVPDGYSVKMTCNVTDYYYNNGEWTISQEMGGTTKTLPFNSGSYNQAIKGATTLTILAKKIVRDKKFTLTYDTSHYTCGFNYVGTKTMLLDANVTSGMEVAYGEADYPILMTLTCTDSQASNNVPWLYINGEFVDSDRIMYYFEAPGYEGGANGHYALPLEAEVDIRYALPYITININDAAGVTATQNDAKVALVNPTVEYKYKDESNADVKGITFTLADGYIFSTFKVNGEDKLNYTGNETVEELKAKKVNVKCKNLQDYNIEVRNIRKKVNFRNIVSQWEDVYAIFSDEDNHTATAEAEYNGQVMTATVDLLWEPTKVTFTDNEENSIEYEFINGGTYGEAGKMYALVNTADNNSWLSGPFVNYDDPEYAKLENGVATWTVENWTSGTRLAVYELTMPAEVALYGNAQPELFSNAPLSALDLSGDYTGINLDHLAGATLNFIFDARTMSIRVEVPTIYMIGDFITCSGSGDKYVTVDHSMSNPDKLCPLTLENGVYKGEYVFNPKTQPRFVFQVADSYYMVKKSSGMAARAFRADSRSAASSFDYTDELPDVGDASVFSVEVPADHDSLVNFGLDSASNGVEMSQEDVATEVDELLSDDAEAVFYNLQGVKVANPDKGVYIRVKGGKTEKVIL